MVHMGSITNQSCLCTNQFCLRFLPHISHYQYFSFNLHGVDIPTKALASVSGEFKIYASDNWSWLHQRKTGHENGLLRSVPTLNKKPWDGLDVFCREAGGHKSF